MHGRLFSISFLLYSPINMLQQTAKTFFENYHFYHIKAERLIYWRRRRCRRRRFWGDYLNFQINSCKPFIRILYFFKAVKPSLWRKLKLMRCDERRTSRKSFFTRMLCAFTQPTGKWMNSTLSIRVRYTILLWLQLAPKLFSLRFNYNIFCNLIM